MRTQSSAKVKHPRTSRACIDHCRREVCNALHMADERENALDDRVFADSALEGRLRDGRYDAFILSADSRAQGVAISCTITTGPHRGDVVDLVSAQFATRDPFDLVGMPCTLVVAGDTIRVEE
jgi:hypothetical protein